jgi:hypothetical protein
MHQRLLAALLAAALCGPVAASAQTAVYRRSPADTLRYEEKTRATIDLSSPQGAFTVNSNHEATIGVTFGAADSARAWYETLVVSAESPQGIQAPATGEVLRQPFLLRIDPRGRVETLATPTFPSSFQGVTDLSRQFFDFFVPLPDAPLRIGASWTDTAKVEGPTAGGGSVSTERIGRYEVVRDSVIGGVPVLVVRSDVETRLTTTASPSPEVEIFNALQGRENGFFYFDAAGGRFVGRTQTGELSGDLQVAGPQPVTLGQRLRYERTVQLLP